MPTSPFVHNWRDSFGRYHNIWYQQKVLTNRGAAPSCSTRGRQRGLHKDDIWSLDHCALPATPTPCWSCLQCPACHTGVIKDIQCEIHVSAEYMSRPLTYHPCPQLHTNRIYILFFIQGLLNQILHLGSASLNHFRELQPELGGSNLTGPEQGESWYSDISINKYNYPTYFVHIDDDINKFRKIQCVQWPAVGPFEQVCLSCSQFAQIARFI